MGGLATHGEVPAAIRLAQHHPDLGHQRRARRAGIPGAGCTCRTGRRTWCLPTACSP